MFFVAEQARVALRNVTCAFPTMPVYTVMSAVLVFINHPRIASLVSVTGTQTPRARPRFATLTLDTACDAALTPPGPGATAALQASSGMPRLITAPVQVRSRCRKNWYEKKSQINSNLIQLSLSSACYNQECLKGPWGNPRSWSLSRNRFGGGEGEKDR